MFDGAALDFETAEVIETAARRMILAGESSRQLRGSLVKGKITTNGREVRVDAQMSGILCEAEIFALKGKTTVRFVMDMSMPERPAESFWVRLGESKSRQMQNAQYN
jgi:hypothetical protein